MAVGAILIFLCLVGRLDEGLEAGCKLALISASAVFGKITLIITTHEDSDLPLAQSRARGN